MNHIGIDAKRAFLNKTGLGQYSRWMLDYYKDRKFFDKVSLFTPKSGPYYTANHAKEAVITPKGFLPAPLWRSLSIPKILSQQGIQTYHGLTNELPFFLQATNIKKLVTIHDVLFKKIPETYSFIDRQIYDFKTKKACQTADKIIVVSEQTKQDLVDFYHTNPDKIHVIYQDCHQQFRQDITTQSKEAYILSVGTLEPRKNHHRLIQALTTLPDHIKLCIAGKKTDYYQKLLALTKAHQLEDRVKFVLDFNFAALPELIHHAKFCCYLSENEGFGIPILEYMAMGKAVILPKTRLAQEVAGDAGIYSSLEVDKLAETIRAFDQNHAKRTEYSMLSKKRAAAYETPRLYNQLDKLFSEIA